MTHDDRPRGVRGWQATGVYVTPEQVLQHIANNDQAVDPVCGSGAFLSDVPTDTQRILDAAREVARVYRAGVTGELTKALAALVETVEQAIRDEAPA